ncbi:hypothetical protein [Treponema sp.]|uniref:hypothetical protein n=1 Tax=Treponema sp. TaxID=166 RepID=UPI003FD770C0
MKYYKVTAKCGHVGKGFYYPGDLFIKADNGRTAAKVAREMPRVKHDHKDAILNVVEIDYDAYLLGKEVAKTNPYFTCESIQDQYIYWDEIEAQILVDDYLEKQSNKKASKKHSLRNVYNADPMYDLYRMRSSKFDYIVA